MSVETITPEKQGKFGPMANGVFYSFSKFYKGPKDLAVGVPVEVDVYVSDTGKKYINAVIGETKVAPKVAKTAESKQTDWPAKDRSQLVGGRSHDAVELVNTSLVTATPLPEVLKLYREALEGVLKVAEEVK